MSPPAANERASAPPATEIAHAPSHDVRHAMWRVTTAWMFGAAWMYLTMGATFTRFARLMGLEDHWFGVLAAMPWAGALAQLGSSYVLTRYGHRKRVLLIAGVISRLTWVVLALIPWVLPRAWWWPALLVVRACSSLSGHFMAPAVLSWFADLFPRRIRGRYFARRNQLGRLVSVVATLVAATVLDHYQAQGQEALMRAVSVILAAGGLFGVIDFLWLIPVPDVAHQADRALSFRRLLREPLRDRDFLHYIGYTATATLGMAFIGQFVWLYLFEVLHLSNKAGNVMLVAVYLVVGYFAVRWWGLLQDRVGCKPTLVLAGIMTVPGAASWIFVTPENWWLGYVGVFLSLVGWSGVELANFNILLGMSASRKGQRQGSAFLAVNYLAVSLAGVVSGLFAAATAWGLKGWEGSLFGWRLTYHGVLFLESGALRLLALFWLIGMREPQAHTTMAAARLIAANIYSNLRQGIFMPTRRVARLGRLAYRLRRRRRAVKRDENDTG
ncbi:MFS transporter [Planctomycetota bacterium]